MDKLRLPIVFLLLFLFFPLAAQNAWVPGLEWRIIEGERADVIFPSGLEEEARRAAALLDFSADELARTLGVERLRRWQLILWYGNSSSNGYVTVAPRHSLWNSGIDSSRFSDGGWLSLMTAHEGRHMAQFDRLAMGGGSVFFALFGDGGTAYLASFCLPDWIFEGDAVLSETLLTEYGRGRSSDFSLDMKSHLLSDGLRYSKVVNGSFRTIYPDWYEYGYFLTAYIRRHFGPEAVEKIFSTASYLPIPMLGYSVGIRAATGRWPSALFQDMAEELRGIFLEQIGKIEESPAEIIDPPGGDVYFALSNPVVFKDGTVALLRSGLDERKQLLLYGTERERLESMNFNHYTGTGIKGSSGGEDRGIFFSGFSSHTRWSGEEYRDIFYLDIDEEREYRLTRQRRFIHAVPGPKGDRLGAVEFFSNGSTELVIFDLEFSPSGPVLREDSRFQPPEGSFPGDLSWSGDGSTLYMTLKGETGQALAAFIPSSGKWRSFTAYEGGRLQEPVEWKEYLLFSSEREGIRNIYALHRETGQRFRITSRLYGASGPAVRGDSLYFIDHRGVNGEALAVTTLQPESWSAVDGGEAVWRVDYFLPILESDPLLGGRQTAFLSPEEGAGEDARKESDPQKYTPEEYSPLKSAINIHSWGLYPEGLLSDPPELRLGLSSADLLGTFAAYGYGSWNLNENTPGGGLAMAFYSLFPVITLSSQVKGRNLDGEEWTEGGIGAGLSLPLDFSMGLKNRGLDISLGAYWYAELDEAVDGGSGYLSADLVWNSYLLGGYQRLYPFLGFSAGLWGAWNPVSESDYVLTGMSRISFPGFFKNDSFRLTAGAELRRGSRSSGLDFSRGYDAVSGNRSLSAILDWDFPILYTELPLGVAYLRRWTGNFYGEFFLQDGELYPSVGFAQFAQVIPLNLTNMILDMGFRLSYLPLENRISWEIVFMDGVSFE